MLLIREVFTAKPGQAGKLAKLFKKTFTDSKDVVMTDVAGEFNTVVVHRHVASLAAFEKEMEEYKSGKMPDMDPKIKEEMSHYTEMYMKGRREIFQILE
jgi:hypothetical protein